MAPFLQRGRLAAATGWAAKLCLSRQSRPSVSSFPYKTWLAGPVLLASITLSPAGGAFDLNHHGLTGSWFKPATAGQGVELEGYQNMIAPGTGFLQGAWFNFDHRS